MNHQDRPRGIHIEYPRHNALLNYDRLYASHQSLGLLIDQSIADIDLQPDGNSKDKAIERTRFAIAISGYKQSWKDERQAQLQQAGEASGAKMMVEIMFDHHPALSPATVESLPHGSSVIHTTGYHLPESMEGSL